MKKTLIVLGIISLLAISTIGNAATGYVDPNGDVATEWTPTPGGTHYTTLDDGTRQNNTPDTGDFLNGTGNNQVDTFNMTTISGASSVTNVTIWGYGNCQATSGDYIQGYTNLTGATTPTSFVFTSTSSWKSISFDVTCTQAELDGLQVSIKNIFPVPLTSGHVYALYCVVTYTAGGGGGGTSPYKFKKKKGVFFIK